MAGFVAEFVRRFGGTAVRVVIVCLLIVLLMAGAMTLLFWPYVVVPVLATGQIPRSPSAYHHWVGAAVLGTTLGWWFVAGYGYHALASMIEDERRLSGESDTRVLKRLIWGESDD